MQPNKSKQLGQVITIIIHGRIDSPPLIRRETMKALGILFIYETGGLKNPNMNILNVKHQIPENASATESC